MTTEHVDHDSRRLTRRELLKAGGLAMGALAVARGASAQTPKPGGSFVSAQDCQLIGWHSDASPRVAMSIIAHRR